MTADDARKRNGAVAMSFAPAGAGAAALEPLVATVVVPADGDVGKVDVDPASDCACNGGAGKQTDSHSDDHSSQGSSHDSGDDIDERSG